MGFNRRRGRGNGNSRKFGSRGKNNQTGVKIPVSKLVNKAVETAVETLSVEVKHLFADFALSESLKKEIAKRGYVKPTPIQDQTIPHILEGRDVVGLANTGTGKTAAFLVPLIEKVLRNRGERVFIVAPTRELALQIEEELLSLTRGMNMRSSLLIGGMKMDKQLKRLRTQPQFVIGTPGRIKDHIKRKTLDLSQFGSVVLDEVDRMLDIGFVKEITEMIALLPETRQSLFFSATMDKRTEGILPKFVKNPVEISVVQRDTAANVDQDVIYVKPGQKVEQLHEVLVEQREVRAIVFGRTKWGVEKLTKILIKRGFKAMAIHGNKSQGQRKRALDSFKSGHTHVLLATDVAARGIHVDDVSHVINYDMPATYEDYVHRIGRTGRANKRGKALTFVE